MAIQGYMQFLGNNCRYSRVILWLLTGYLGYSRVIHLVIQCSLAVTESTMPLRTTLPSQRAFTQPHKGTFIHPLLTYPPTQSC